MNKDASPTFPNFWEYRISSLPVSALAEQALAAIQHKARAVVFACANPHSLNVANKDYEFRQALLNSDVLVADGVGLAAFARLFGAGRLPRVTGTDYFEAVLGTLNNAEPSLGRKGRVFFFGSSQKVLDLISGRFNSVYPNLELVGAISPPYGEWSDALNVEMVEKIKSAKPDILWVGMTAPKQEKWSEKNREILNVPVIGSIGAVFDFFAGTYPRAPKWACALGLEWLVRLVREPRRMWKRTIISMPLFAIHTVKYYLLSSSTNTDLTNR